MPTHQDHPRPFHRAAVFGPGTCRPLTSDQRRAWLARVDVERRTGNLTALHAEIARALARRLGVDGQLDPSHATIATDAGCGERTVRRALTAMRDIGLISWEQRLVRRPWPAGGSGATRAEQTSNAYVLQVPTRLARLRPKRPIQLRLRCGGQVGHETQIPMIPSAMPTLDEAELRRLTAIQAARRARLDAEWLAQRAQRWRAM